METRMPSNPPTRPTLLLVDDEERILRSLAMLFRAHYQVHATTDAREALAIVAREPVHVVVSDQRMPIMRGADLLREIRTTSPRTMRLLLTGYSELDSVVASVNEGEIFRFVTKPWEAQALRDTVDQAAQIALRQFADVEDRKTQIRLAEPPRTRTTGFLVIDDDREVWKVVNDLVGSVAPVHLARTLDEAFALLAACDIGVIISELVVDRQNMTAAIKLLKASHPELVTIVMTPFQDTATLIGLINQGQVFRLLPKPVRRGPLGMSLAAALRQHHLLRTAPKLLERHAVEALRAPEELTVASRVMGLIGRLRQRAGRT